MNRKSKIEIARTLRKQQTQAESILWDRLKNRKFLNLKFRRQHVIQGFIADFYCHELKLIIEADGKIHDTQKEYDMNRDFIINKSGTTILRFNNNEIINNIQNVINAIKMIIPLLPVGEGSGMREEK